MFEKMCNTSVFCKTDPIPMTCPISCRYRSSRSNWFSKPRSALSNSIDPKRDTPGQSLQLKSGPAEPSMFPTPSMFVWAAEIRRRPAGYEVVPPHGTCVITCSHLDRQDRSVGQTQLIAKQGVHAKMEA